MLHSESSSLDHFTKNFSFIFITNCCVTYLFHEYNKWRYPMEKLFLRWTLVISKNNHNLLSSRSQIIELFSAFYSISLQFQFQTTRNVNSLYQSNLIRKGFTEPFSAYWSYGWPCIATIWRPLCRRIINKKTPSGTWLIKISQQYTNLLFSDNFLWPFFVIKSIQENYLSQKQKYNVFVWNSLNIIIFLYWLWCLF